MTTDVLRKVERLGPGDFISHEDLCQLMGAMPDSLRELDVPVHQVERRALRRREVAGRKVWEAIY